MAGDIETDSDYEETDSNGFNKLRLESKRARWMRRYDADGE